MIVRLFLKRAMLSVLCFVMLVSVFMPALAASGPGSTDGSLTIHYHHGREDFADVGVHVHKIANMDGSGKFTATEVFAAYPFDIGSGMTAQGWTDLAVLLAGYVSRDEIAVDYDGVTDGDGVCRFDSMGAGLYLVTGDSHRIQQEDSTRVTYYQMAPFLVALPSLVDGQWVDAVATSPKFTATERDEVSVRVLKSWDDEGFEDDRPESVIFDLVCDGEVYDTVTLTARESWRYQWDGLDGSKSWQVVERAAGDYLVTASWHGITYLVTNRHKDVDNSEGPGGTEFPTPPIDIDDPDVPLGPGNPTDPDPGVSSSPDPAPSESTIPGVEITPDVTVPGVTEQPGGINNNNGNNNNGGGTYVPGTPSIKDEPKLPQTGQVWWPVPVLVVAGWILFIIGCVLRGRKNCQHPAACLFIVLAGMLCVSFAVLIAVGNLAESNEAGEYVQGVNRELETRIQESPMRVVLSDPEFVPDYVLDPEMDMPVEEIDGRLYVGEISFPTLDLKFAVQSDWSMANLAKSPCRYSGTAYDDAAFVICAHNYVTHFWPIRELAAGDRVTFTDCDGNVFEYVVVGSEQIQPRPVTQVTESEHDLVLFTCALSGTKRIAVFCDLVSETV